VATGARQRLWLGALLFLAVWVVYLPALRFPFLAYDDPDYVTANPVVRAGLSAEGLRHALEPGRAGNWHPLTWISHMLDVELFGLDARFHHATSVALHALVAVLAFVLFVRLAGSLVAAAFAALAFALHPLRVESVVWISERKDVLSVAFGLASVLAYLRYAERPRAWRYALVTALVALGLAAKSMLVTLPLLFLLLDVWPLRRSERFSILLAEKVPFFLLAAATSVLTLVAQRRAGTLSGLEALPFAARLGNACVAIAAYLGDLVLPVGLGPFYPYPQGRWPLVSVAAALGLLLFVSAVAWRARRRRPWLVFGWLWFLLALLPVLGIVQIGVQARADRYTYLPQLGLFAALAVEGARFAAPRSRAAQRALAACACVVVVALALGTASQIRFWRDTETLFARALAVTSDNDVAHYALSMELVRRGALAEGLSHAEEAVRLRPASARAQEQLGDCLARLGRREEALAHLAEAVRLEPRRATTHALIGGVLLEGGRPLDAIAPLERASELDPELVAPWANLGLALVRTGRPDAAIGPYTRAIALDPSLVETRLQLASTLVELKRYDQAERACLDLLATHADEPRAHAYLAAIALARGDLDAARARAEIVRRYDPRMADAILSRLRDEERSR
jgi:tetratricopeptide (TPR) repeat protein